VRRQVITSRLEWIAGDFSGRRRSGSTTQPGVKMRLRKKKENPGKMLSPARALLLGQETD
jgi:hypothetical protein